MPTSRRLLVLCSPASGKVVGVQMVEPTLDIGMNGSQEETGKGSGTISGTSDYKSLRQAIKVSDAMLLHSVQG